MWRSRTVSGLGIADYGIAKHFITKVDTEILSGEKVNLAAAKQSPKLFFHFGEPEEADDPAGAEVDENVDITRISKAIREDGTKERQFPNAIGPAELGDLCLWDRDGEGSSHECYSIPR